MCKLTDEGITVLEENLVKLWVEETKEIYQINSNDIRLTKFIRACHHSLRHSYVNQKSSNENEFFMFCYKDSNRGTPSKILTKALLDSGLNPVGAHYKTVIIILPKDFIEILLEEFRSIMQQIGLNVPIDVVKYDLVSLLKKEIQNSGREFQFKGLSFIPEEEIKSFLELLIKKYSSNCIDNTIVEEVLKNYYY